MFEAQAGRITGAFTFRSERFALAAQRYKSLGASRRRTRRPPASRVQLTDACDACEIGRRHLHRQGSWLAAPSPTVAPAASFKSRYRNPIGISIGARLTGIGP